MNEEKMEGERKVKSTVSVRQRVFGKKINVCFTKN